MSDSTLLVELHGTVVGHLWSDGAKSLFSFHESYLNSTGRPVLGQHFEDRLLKQARRVRGMHPWFENALPDESGTLRQRYGRVLGIKTGDSIAMLAALGQDLPGAVVLRSADGDPPVADVIDEERADPVARARFSLGGVQVKFSMSGDPDRLSLGVEDPDGKGWILKIGGAQYPDLAENEHSMMGWSRRAGFDVPETHIVQTAELPELGPIPSTPTAYLVERYDRTSRGRVHQEDFAQVMNAAPDRKFEATDSTGLLNTTSQIMGPTKSMRASGGCSWLSRPAMLTPT